jgi:hypothetical protein
VRIARWIYISPIDADGRGANKAQFMRLFFGLDLDDLHLAGGAFLGHNLA